MDRTQLLAAVEQWLSGFGLPPTPVPRTKDLAGKTVRVCSSQDEDVIRFFFPRRSIPVSNNMIKEMVRLLRRRGATVERVQLSVEAYARWIDGRGLKDTEELRYEFASKLPPEA
jgi:hypothetical protein